MSTEITADEFVDFWEGKIADDGLMVDWLGEQLQSDEGLDVLSGVINTLEERHGATSENVIGLRAFIKKAYDKLEKDGIELERKSFSFDKVKGKAVSGSAYFHTPKKGGRKADPAKTAKRQIDKWFKSWHEQGLTHEEIYDKIQTALDESRQETFLSVV